MTHPLLLGIALGALGLAALHVAVYAVGVWWQERRAA